MDSLLALALLAGTVGFEGRIVEPPCVVEHVEAVVGQQPQAQLYCSGAKVLPQLIWTQVEKTTQQEEAWVVRLDYL